MISLQFGLAHEVPADRAVAYGARWIFPDQPLWDRQSFAGLDTPEGQRLQKWLNGGALKKASAAAARMSKHSVISPDSGETVALYEDDRAKIVANPQRSYGYLYVAAYLKHEAAA